MLWTNLDKVMNDYTAFVDSAVKSKMPSYWQLKSKMTFFLNVGSGIWEICFNAPEYWKYANAGRKPGKFPPPLAIDAWITKRGITPYPMASGKLPTRKQLVFLISRKIAKNGVKETNFLELGLQEQEDYWLKRIEDAVFEDVKEELRARTSPLGGKTKI